MNQGHYPAGYSEAPRGEEDHQSLASNVGHEDVHAPQHGELHWNSGICACCDDFQTCCLGCWCPCVVFGQNVEKLEGKPWIGPCIVHFLLWGVVTAGCCVLTKGTVVGLVASCVPCYACNYRKAIRTKYHLEDAPCGDALTHVCCHLCANCQEYRELKERAVADGGLPAVVPPPLQAMHGPTSSPHDELDDFPK